MYQAYDSVRMFESCISEYAGSKYGVAVDSCTNALFLCCKWFKEKEIEIPSKTYFSVPSAILHSGSIVKFKNREWKGEYFLNPLPIIDSALKFSKNMHKKNTFRCLSFNSMKHLKIGKGGMILTDDYDAYKWFKSARYMGRHESPCYNENCKCSFETIDMVGWSMYMTPDQASRGLMLMRHMPDTNPDLSLDFPDLSKYEIFRRGHYETINRAPA